MINDQELDASPPTVHELVRPTRQPVSVSPIRSSAAAASYGQSSLPTWTRSTCCARAAHWPPLPVF
jgi:hypothetical protein